MSALAHVCPFLPERFPFDDSTSSESIHDTIENISPNLQDILDKCGWQNRKMNCSEIFSPVLTEDGLCVTFNALNSYETYTDE